MTTENTIDNEGWTTKVKKIGINDENIEMTSKCFIHM